jgi:hypothetical protein
MKIKENRKGFLFTIAAIMLIVPLVYLIAFYGRVGETQMDDTVGKIRCDELHYYVEDVKRDTARALTVFGRRAAMLAIDDILQNESFLDTYEFKCTSECKVNCSNFEHPENGSEAAIAELIVCGTLYGNNVSSMVNHTLVKWKEKMIDEGELMDFNVNITPFAIDVVPVDSWHFAAILQNKISVSDKEGLCYYSQNVVTAVANTSIIGLEDPMYMLKNMQRKYILNCSPEAILPNNMIGCSKDAKGDDSGGGNVVFYSKIPNADKGDYCSDNADKVGGQILVIDQAFGACNQMESDCFNITKPNHFAGVVEYAKNSLNSFIGKCGITIPWISATGELDDFGPFGGGNRDLTCGTDDLEIGDCVYIINDAACTPELHYILYGYNSEGLNTSCYYVSDINETGSYNDECDPPEKYPNGPSFFDRLDGNLNLSQKYVNQSVKYFNNRLIGMESFVDLYDLYFLKNQGYDVEVNTSRSWVDYLYWQSKPGCRALGYCEMNDFAVRVDCPHAYKYELKTDCSTGGTCPVCPDGRCSIGENYVKCLSDCACTAGCPQNAGITACKTLCGGGPNCDVKFSLQVKGCSQELMDLSSAPNLNVTIESVLASWGPMTHVGLGKYNSTVFNKNKNRYINGSLLINESGCLAIYNITEADMRIMDLGDC